MAKTMSLGARIKELRIKKNKSLQDVADAVKASKAHIWEIERGGSKNPTMELLTNLADYFEVTVSYLVGEERDRDQAEMVALYRDLKRLDDTDQETIRELMRRFKSRKGSA
jgi:transcriptional regulator with XRE-family HTH domain